MTEITLAEVQKKLRNIENEKKELNKELKQNFNLIKDIFKDVSVSPEITTSKESTMSNFSITFNYNHLATVDFYCSLINKAQDVKITESITYECSKKQGKKSGKTNNNLFNKFSIMVGEIGKSKNKLSEKLLFEVLTFVRKYLVAERKLNKKLSVVKDELILVKKQKEVEKIKQLFVPLGNFCLNTFLCKENGVIIEGDKPTQKEIREMKERCNSSKKYNFVVMDFEGEYMYFNHVWVSFYNKELYVTKSNKKLTSLKQINQTLSQQVKYKGKVITYNEGYISEKIPYLSGYINSSNQSISDLFNNKEFKLDLMSNKIANF